MCTLNPPCVIRPSSNWPQLEWDGPAVGKKAASRPSEHRIWVEKKFWDSIAQLAARPAIAARQRLALVCHEKGHDEGAECEECADTRGGQIYRELGLKDDDAAVELFLTRLQNRSADGAAAAFHAGFQNVHGERPADAGQCMGSVDGAGLCKAAPVMSFYGAEGVETRRAKARARGMDEGQCRCIHAGAGLPVADDTPGADFQLCPACCLYTNGVCDCSPEVSECGGGYIGWGLVGGRGRVFGGRGGGRGGHHADAPDDHGRCPVCGGESATVCRCSVSAAKCKNGHEWHLENGMVVAGPGHHGRATDAVDKLIGATSAIAGLIGMSASVFLADDSGVISAVAPWSAADISADLAQIPFFRQTFDTSNGPGGSSSDSLADIIAAAAVTYFPDEPRRWAWLLAATVYLEAPRSTGAGVYAGGLNASGDNRKKDPSHPGYLIASNANGSVDYGLMQINNQTHSSLLAQQLSDGTPAWENARLNMAMGAQILAQARQDQQGNIAAALLDYQGGPRFVAQHLRDTSAYLRSNLPAIPADSDSAGWRAIAAADPLGYKLCRLASWGAPDPMDPAAWSAAPGDADNAIAAAHASAASAISDMNPSVVTADATQAPADSTDTSASTGSAPSAPGAPWVPTADASAGRPAWIMPLAVGLAVLVVGYLLLQGEKPAAEGADALPVAA